MKIITWNVNGFRALLRKGAWEWVVSESPDLVCLQEIKARPDQLTTEQQTEFDLLATHWNPAERPGYSGVLTLSKERKLININGLGIKKFDREGRIIQTRIDDFILFNVYFPNGQRDKKRLKYKLDFYAKLLEHCDELHSQGEQVIICGDFNTAHSEIDLRNPKENSKTSGFLPEERAWVDKYIEHGFVDAYRVFYPERVQYTWWTYRYNARKRNIGWRLDYYLVSEKLFPMVEDVVINDQVIGSDHCPVTLIMK
ncbi:MAG: exodeoxyribonuclease III [Chloroflexi bacterium]|nr:exodeoxyribonuclease III [Chloroflexota bacterium]